MATKNIRLKDGSGNTLLPLAYSVASTTWSSLKALRDAGGLEKGLRYRITDYTTTTTQEDTQSAGHQYDIIVTALSPTTLSEEAEAIMHEGDTYFAKSRLAAWRLWYSLDNDTSRFAWADTENGRGVVYRMIDEWGNDCPYDFKNIQFKRYKVTAVNGVAESPIVGYYYGMKVVDEQSFISTDGSDSIFAYTFTGVYDDGTETSGDEGEIPSLDYLSIYDASLNQSRYSHDLEGGGYAHPNISLCEKNVLSPQRSSQTIDDSEISYPLYMSDIVFLCLPQFYETVCAECPKDNHFSSGCKGITALDRLIGNSFNTVVDTIFDGKVQNNSVQGSLNSCTFSGKRAA